MTEPTFVSSSTAGTRKLRPGRRAALLALCLGLAAPAAAEVSLEPEQAGIAERLDAQVPLDLLLVDESGQQVTLGTLIDRPTLLTLNYFRCSGICTPQLNGVAKLLSQIALVPGKDFRVLTVSFDDRDTPAIAERKRANYFKTIGRPLAPDSWRFLTGTAATTRALADAVGYRFMRQGDDFIHATAIIVLSPKGHVTRYINGVSYLPADVEMAVAEAAAGLTRPTIAKWASFCYSYDPKNRRFALDITRVAGLLTLSGLGLFLALVVVRGRGRKRGGGAEA